MTTDSASFEANLSSAAGRPFLDELLPIAENGAVAAGRGNHIEISESDFSRSTDARSGARWLEYPGWQSLYMICNPQGKLASVEQRKALYQAIGREELVNIFFQDAQELEYLLPAEAIVMVPSAQPEMSADATSKLPMKLRLAYATGDDILRLTAERIAVDLYLAGVELTLEPYTDIAPQGADIYLSSRLIFAAYSEYSLWQAMAEFARLTGEVSFLRQPGEDLYLWFLELERWNRSEELIRPMFCYRWGVSLSQRLRGTKFRADGTLDFSNAWLAPAGEGR
jgi:MarR-like DNA-binding transcriptional regulator SgrR of sgrS sRNA